MKRIYLCFLIMLFVPFVLGMGSSITGGDSPDAIPVPEKKFSVTFVDQMDIVTNCTDVSIEGRTFIEGVRGEGRYTIPFKEIKSIKFFLKDETLTGSVILKNNNTEELILDTGDTVYGRTQYGTFRIGYRVLRR